MSRVLRDAGSGLVACRVSVWGCGSIAVDSIHLAVRWLGCVLPAG